MKDWNGNKISTFACLGASNHSESERQSFDYYATEPKATEELLKKENFSDVWECACGELHISKVLESHGIKVRSSDLIDRTGNIEVVDFLKVNDSWGGDIVTNPPYKFAKDFVEKSISIIPEGRKVAMFLKLTFLESKSRKELFKRYPPKRIYVASERFICAMNGDFENTNTSAVCYAWFIWEKGFQGKPEIDWIN